MVRDDERRTEAGERRSKGYGFVTFKAMQEPPPCRDLRLVLSECKYIYMQYFCMVAISAVEDHDSAMKALEFLNDNPLLGS